MRAIEPEIPYPCPICLKRQINAKATSVYVRGLIIWFRMGERTAIGCVRCVRGKVFGEAGLSLLIGWFSPIALVLNPLLVLYGLVQGLFVGPNKRAARRYLHNGGFPTGVEGDLQRVCYGLAVALTGGQWTKAAQELSARELISLKQVSFSADRLALVHDIGRRVVPNYDAAEFELYVAMSSEVGHPLHVAEAAQRILQLDERQKASSFIGEIASALNFPPQRLETCALIQRTLVKTT